MMIKSYNGMLTRKGVAKIYSFFLVVSCIPNILSNIMSGVKNNKKISKLPNGKFVKEKGKKTYLRNLFPIMYKKTG